MANDPNNPRRIGNMNGPWAIGLKIMLATYPVLLTWLVGWGGYMTRETILTKEFREKGARFTPEDALNMRREIDAQFATMPPKDWRDKYANMEAKLEANSAALIRIEVILQELKQHINGKQ